MIDKHKEIQNAINKVKKVTVTINTKKCHKPKVWEMEDLIEELSYINPYVIHEDSLIGYREYKNLVYRHYDKTTKKELDQKLKYAKVNLINTLVRIYQYSIE